VLREIHIQNYAVIDNLTVEFGPGLNLLSGETGSGKSIIVDALGLALGGRASPEIIRTGQERATVTAVFRAEAFPPWAAWLEEHGLASQEESEIILRREIQASGRSRLLVNDQPVTVGAIRELAERLIEIHGQNEQVLLFEKEGQLDLLDEFAELGEAVEQVGRLHARRAELEREIASLSRDEQERLRTLDLLRFQVEELERARLEPGEDSRLEEERRVLANLEKLRAAASDAYTHLYEDEGAACAKLALVNRALDDLARYDSALDEHREPFLSARAALEDLADSLRDYLQGLEANPARLEEIEDRLALIDRLKRKYGKTIEEILAYCEDARRQLSGLEHADERRVQLEKELNRAMEEYTAAATDVSRRRQEAARRMERAVRQELSQLGMEKTRFAVHFSPEQPGSAGPKGFDDIEFLIAPNPGEEMRPLAKVASGGELSRLMLALKTVVGVTRTGGAGRDGTKRYAPTFVFDEVDAGIGGRVAESVGQRLKRLARSAQVLCVTHLAQIACFADHHFYVEKFERQGRTLTSVKRLDGEKERAQELARMLSGSQITDAVLKHAGAMLKQAASTAN